MKLKSFRFLAYITIPLLVTISLTVGLFVLRNKVPFSRAAMSDNLAGHAWDTYYGWSSYNSCNPSYSLPDHPVLENCYLPDWGLNATFVTDAGGNITSVEVSGFIWHAALGWICVGSTCAAYTGANQCGADTTPPQGNLAVTAVAADPIFPAWWPLTGWGKICAWGNTAGDAAWLSFNCDNTGGCAASDYQVYINVDNFTLGGPEPVCPVAGVNNCGFAWNGYTVGGEDYGTGFILFSEATSIAHYVHFRTEAGDVYTYANINQRLDPTVPSATFLVLSSSDTIVNFTSAEAAKTIAPSYLQASGDLFGLTPPNKLPQKIAAGTRIYSNALSTLDVEGMIAGKYGTVVTIANDSYFNTNSSLLLNDRVFYDADNLILDNSTAQQFLAGTNATESGAGTIVVNGNLTINRNINYQQGNLTNLINLPSVTWIVLGDVVVDPTVTEIVGNFFVLGNGVTTCPSLSEAAAGCGRFSSGISADNSLEVQGLVMARQFSLQRSYTDPLNTPAELFFYDGRLIANVPPGLDELTESLPFFSESSPF